MIAAADLKRACAYIQQAMKRDIDYMDRCILQGLLNQLKRMAGKKEKK